MFYKKLLEKETFHYQGSVLGHDDVLTIDMDFKVKVGDYIKLISVGEEKKYLEIHVIITHMDLLSAYLWGKALKNLNNRQLVSNKFWYLSQVLKQIISEYLENMLPSEDTWSVIVSIDYIGEIPTSLENYYKD